MARHKLARRSLDESKGDIEMIWFLFVVVIIGTWFLQILFASTVFGIICSHEEEAILMLAMFIPIIGLLFTLVKAIFNKIHYGRYSR
jgi:hypothetical protein